MDKNHPDAEMLKNLDLLLDMEVLENEKDWELIVDSDEIEILDEQPESNE